jgi:hypothetical protein
MVDTNEPPKHCEICNYCIWSNLDNAHEITSFHDTVRVTTKCAVRYHAGNVIPPPRSLRRRVNETRVPREKPYPSDLTSPSPLPFSSLCSCLESLRGRTRQIICHI